MSSLNNEPEVMEDAASVQDVVNEQAVTQDIDNNNFEVEVVDDVPEKEKPRLEEDREPEVPSEEEIETYSAGVQKRLNKLKFEAREQERQKLEATRLQEEALRYAQNVKAENEKLKKTLDDGEGTLIEQAKSRIEAQMDI